MTQPISRESLPDFRQRVEITDDYTLELGDHLVAVVDLPTSITVTLPDPSTLGILSPFVIKDETGLASLLTTITIQAPNGVLIDGQSTLTLNSAFAGTFLYTDGKNFFRAHLL